MPLQPPHQYPYNVILGFKRGKNTFVRKDGETVLQSIDNQSEILQKANQTETSYLEVISTNGEQKDRENFSKFQKHVLSQKCQLLCFSLWFARKNLNKWIWQQCFSASIKVSLRTGFRCNKKFRNTDGVVQTVYSYIINLKQIHKKGTTRKAGMLLTKET
jgi:hypothetical protein